MANALFDKAREFFLTQSTVLDFDTDTIKVYGIDQGADTPVPATDDFADDLSAPSKIFTSGALASKTGTAGVADAADVTITAVTGASVESLVIWKDSGTQSTSPLIAYIDTATGLPVTPNGGDITIQWDNGANKIFKL